MSVKARLYNPSLQSLPCSISIQVFDAAGNFVHKSTRTLAPWDAFTELASFHVVQPRLWSPELPHLYRCEVTLSTSKGQTHLDERFGIRSIEFVEHGPFKLNGQRCCCAALSVTPIMLAWLPP